jgi:uncharacterized protein YqcC (DUF446 family)
MRPKKDGGWIQWTVIFRMMQLLKQTAQTILQDALKVQKHKTKPIMLYS